MFIYGWGRQIRTEFGPLFMRLCTHCNNEQYWNLSSVSVWFTIFFIPVIPYKFIRRVYCPVCRYGFDLDSEKFEELKPIAINNKKLVDGEITVEQYNELINGKNTENKSMQESVEKLPDSTKKSDSINFCKDCGYKINQIARFCGNCGVGVHI